MDSLSLRECSNKQISTNDINCWLSHCDLKELTPFKVHPVVLRVDMANLTKVESLSIRSCTIVVPDKVFLKLKPRKIHLECVRFEVNRQSLGSCFVNDFIDFSKATQINIQNSKLYSERELIFDVRTLECNLDLLRLEGVNFSSEKVLEKNGFTLYPGKSISDQSHTHNKIRVKKMIIQNCIFDVSCIPRKVESLCILHPCKIIMRDNLESTCLNNLEFLRVSNMNEIISTFWDVL
jgi:hypothetical protein